MAVLPSRVYADRLFSATELNRQTSQVLDLALKQPVTVTRGDEAFALLRREVAGRMSDLQDHAVVLVDLFVAVNALRTSGPLTDQDHHFCWLAVFEADDLTELLVEAGSAFKNAMAGEGSWEEFETVLHEWHESAMAVGSKKLADAFAAEGDEVLLAKPETENPAEPFSEATCG